MAKAPLFIATYMPEEAKLDFYKAISEWHAVTEELAPLVEQEVKLRKALFDTYFATSPKIEEGTNHIGLGFGKQLTADYRVNRKLDEAQLDAARQAGLIPEADINMLINMKPNLKIGEWKDAGDDVRKRWAEIITETPGTPGLKITTPKT